MTAYQTDPRPIRIGISSCLLGEQVRFDGGHKRDDFLVQVLGPHVEWVPVCPEVEIGLGVPRESIRLERQSGLLRLVAPKSGIDHAQTMRAWSRRRLKELAREDLSGYVLKSKSPSCGMERVPIYDKNGVPAKRGRGLFAEALLDHFGNLPVEEEGRLNDPVLRENFIERVFACHRLQGLFAGRWRARDAVAFHTAHKFLLMAHSPKHYRSLGRLVAALKTMPSKQFRDEYESGFMQAMRLHATVRKHSNVLEHMLGYLSDFLGAAARKELLTVIADYRRRLVPLIVPVTLIRHCVRTHNVAYLESQFYLEPHPGELMLRNHV
jgi:uncharacterized protein YbgA (DUF1722 family)/uncharacterized protein YbbK (DUF523 family)